MIINKAKANHNINDDNEDKIVNVMQPGADEEDVEERVPVKPAWDIWDMAIGQMFCVEPKQMHKFLKN